MKINPCFSWFHSHPSLLIFSNILICCTYHNLQQLDCWLRRLMNKENYSIYILVYTCNPIDVPNKEICQLKKFWIVIYIWYNAYLGSSMMIWPISGTSILLYSAAESTEFSRVFLPLKSIDKLKWCLWNTKEKPAWMLLIQ